VYVTSLQGPRDCSAGRVERGDGGSGAAPQTQCAAAAFISAKQGRCRRWWRPSKDPKGRFGYVGVDNRDAGATAAYLTNEWLGDSPASVLVTLSSNAFRGEEEREMGSRGEMRCALGGQGRAAVKITEGQGLDATIERLVLDTLDRDPTIGAVYSIGGSNVATIRAFERRGRHTACSSPTISTRTIGCCCAPARSLPCYITTSEPMPTGRPHDHSGARRDERSRHVHVNV
jgi:hypothetical protein